MHRSILLLAAASVAIAAPSNLRVRQDETPVDPVVTDATTATDLPEVTGAVSDVAETAEIIPGLNIDALIEILSEENTMMDFRGEMSMEEAEAMREIEAIIAELRDSLEMLAEKKEARSLDSRQLNILTSLLGSLLGTVGGATGNIGGLGGLLGGLPGLSILGRVKPEDLSAEETKMFKEAEGILMELTKELKTQADGMQEKAARRQLPVPVPGLGILFQLPIVGPLLQALLGSGSPIGGITDTVGGLTGGLTGGGAGGALGGLTGTVGGLTGGLTGGGGAGGALGGLTGTVGGLTGGLTGGAGGAGGALSGVTDTVGGLTGGLTGGSGGSGPLGGVTGALGGVTGGLPLVGGLLGRVDVSKMKVSEEQLAEARKASDLLTKLSSSLEAKVKAE